jgi:hypothetical protein
MNICEYCDFKFTTTQSLKRHYGRCKEKDKRNLIVHYESQIENFQQQIQQYEKQLENQREQYEKQLEKLENHIQKLENQIFEIAKQPKQSTVTNNNNNTNTQTTNNRILNITNNLVPMDLTDEQIRDILKINYTRNVFLGGPDSITEMTVSRLLTDQETGKFRIVCTDASRSVFYYQDCDENLIKDIGMKDIHKKIQKPLVEATSSHYNKIDAEKSMNDDKLSELFIENMSFIDNELPNRLKRNLQLPINIQE